MNPRDLTQIGPYTVTRFVAEGGMAWVFEVVDPKFSSRRLALKLLKPEAAVGEEFERFRDEAQLLAAINHPYLVTIFDFGLDEASGCHYYTMEFVDGPTIAQRLSESGAFSVEDAGRIFVQVLEGLAELHRRQIVHRDIKPANVLLGADGRPRLADLGIARQQQQETGRTRTGTAIGTVAYMSPEQARGQPVDSRSDVFSVGLTLYEVLTGQSVYDGVEDLDSTSSYEVLGYLVSLSRTGDEIHITYPPEVSLPRPVVEVIEKACRFYAEDRYADAAEMAVALEQALRPAPEVVVAQASRWPLIGAAAGLVVLLAAGVGYWLIKAGQDRAAAEASVGRARSLGESVPALLERVKDLEPAPPREALQGADDALERAQNYLVDCGEEYEAEEFAVATRSCQRAQQHFVDVCRQLTGTDVDQRSEQRVAAADARLTELRAAVTQLPEERVPQAWSELEKQMAALGPPGAEAPPCAILGAQLDRIDGAAQVVSLATDLEAQLAEVWPSLAENARNEVLTAQKLAEAPIEAPPYVAARDAAAEALAKGQHLEKEGDYLEARAAFQDALAKFKTAAAIVPAAQARSDVRRFESEMPEGVDLGRWSVRIARADDLYSRGEWESAADLYRDALKGARGALQEADLENEARTVRASARATRDAAVAEGAPSSATGPFQLAEQALAEAEKALGDRKFEEAQQQFQHAQTLFGEARDASIQALAGARDQATQARRALAELVGEAGCPALESAAAREECESASADLARGGQAVEQQDAATAVGSFRTAIAAVDRARVAEGAYLETKPRPPEIVSRTPKRDQVEETRNKRVKFAVEAKDPNPEDRLRYAWSFDGRPLDAAGAELELPLERDGRLSVTVADGRGGSDTASWEIVVKNRKPKIALTPRSQTISLTPGASENFEVQASDPDGDPVETVFQLDGKQVASGSAWRFEGSRVGRHELSVVATDAAGARTVVKRTIVVAAKPAPVAKPTPKPAPAPVAPRPEPKPEPVRVAAVPPPSPPPSESAPWKGDVRRTLERYAGCLNAKDMKCLERVWRLPPDSIYRKRWESKFRRPEAVEVYVDIEEMKRKNDGEVTVLYKQREISSQRERLWNYEAVLLKRRTTDEWQIIENHLRKG